MRRTLMKSKIHRATVTGADLAYEGSVTLDPVLMEAADLLPNERVEIYDVTNGERFATYVIEGTPGAGEVVLNGAAAHKVTPGDLVILCSYAAMDEPEARGWEPRVVFVDRENRIVARRGERVMPVGAQASRPQTSTRTTPTTNSASATSFRGVISSRK